MNDVEKAIWLHWKPAQHIRPADPALHERPGVGLVRDPGEYVAYLAWAEECKDVVRLTMLALASLSTPMNTVQALTYQKQDVLAQKIGRSTRQLRTILRRLEWADEINTFRCDGRGCFGKHGRSLHYYINLPVGAPEFDAVAAARTRRRKSRSRT